MKPALLRSKWLPLVAALVPLLALYLTTLQTIPNGSSHYFMIDVGETQIVLNEWGSLHPTGYPHYVISGNALAHLLRLAGIGPLAAPALVSLFWGVPALLLFFRLGLRLGAHPWLVAGITLLFGLTRSVWIHNVIAEIYSLNLVLLLTLLNLASLRRTTRKRLCWLAFVGGIALAHHRAFVTFVPALLYIVWPSLGKHGKRLPSLLPPCLLLAAAGFIPYLWPLLRAGAGAAWVYGEPATLPTLLDVIFAAEYTRFIASARSFSDLLHNIRLVNDVLINELSLPGILVGLAGYVPALKQRQRPAALLLIMGLTAWLFHMLFYSDVLSALILPVTLSLAFGWLLAAGAVIDRPGRNRGAWLALGVTIITAALLLINHNLPFIRGLTSDPGGLETVETLEPAPAGSTVMLAWGPRYFAAAASQLYLQRLPHVNLVDDKADVRHAFLAGELVSIDYTFFNQPQAWWERKLGQPVWLEAAGPRLVRIRPEPSLRPGVSSGPHVTATELHCESDRLLLEVVWNAGDASPQEDLSVFVKAIAADGSLLAQGDQFAPVYGLRPTSGWLPHEELRDFYPVAVDPVLVASLDFGLYRTSADGEFTDLTRMQRFPVCS